MSTFLYHITIISQQTPILSQVFRTLFTIYCAMNECESKDTFLEFLAGRYGNHIPFTSLLPFRTAQLYYLYTENLKDENTITPVTDRDQRKFRSYLYNRKLLLRKKTSDPETHEIFCTQCSSSSLHGYWKTPATRTTSSHLLVHFRNKHPDLPTNDTEEEKICLRLGLPKSKSDDDANSPGEANLWKPRKSDEPFVPEVFQMLLAKAILATNLPVEIVEIQEFQDLLLYLNPEAPTPSRADVHEDIAKLLKNGEKTDHVR